ncbi:Protein crossbronx-like [Hypsizygus marmoreus]|uniref:Protein crossbronx-like n=1 Tax=Hypsizygus marmoreus TaxID=39966 RepID=A0A369JQ78_HYPMA|nr:Protein crossbronx-like [Hypsizygus marmoreus]
MASKVTSSTSADVSKYTGRATSRSTGNTAATMAADMISPVTRTAVSLEYASLRHTLHCPLGMYVVPSVENLLVWDAVFFIHQGADYSFLEPFFHVLTSQSKGYYADAILKFRLTFPSNYPERPPMVQFVTDVFHPLVSSQNGTFNMAPRFRPWRYALTITSQASSYIAIRPKEHHVFDVLHYIKAAFKKHALDGISESDCLNKEAFRYHNSTSSFAALATQSSLLSQSASALFDRDHPSMAGKVTDGITFREMSASDLQEGRSKLGLKEWSEESS